MKKLFILLTVCMLLSSCSGTTLSSSVQFQGKTFQRSALSAETVRWLKRYDRLSEEEKLCVDYIPPELRDYEEGEAEAPDTVPDGASADAIAEVKWAMIPMVMADGVLYLDTGFESTEPRCGVMDGEITSTVEGCEKPSKDGQSNFGKGYGYQIGEKGTIEVNIDGCWRIFATEEKRRELQFPDRIELEDRYAGLSPEDAKTLSALLEAGEWAEGTADCLNDYAVTLDGKTVYYHLSCGTFNDNEGQRSLTLDEETAGTVAGLLQSILPVE